MPVSRHPARASPSGPLARSRTIHSVGSGSSSGPFTTTCVAASNLSVGSGVVVIFFCWAHLTASARFRVRAPGPVSGRLCTTIRLEGRHIVVVSRCLSATGICFSVILRPPRNPALLTVGLPDQGSGPRRDFRVPHIRAAIGVGALCAPGTTVLIPDGATSRPASAASQRHVPAPRRTSHPRGLRLTRHQPRVHACSPVRSSPACGRPDGTGRPWALRRASHPADQEPDDARRGGDRPSSTDLELLAQLTSVDLQSGSSLVVCDLASHVAKRSSGIAAARDRLAANALVRPEGVRTRERSSGGCALSAQLAICFAPPIQPYAGCSGIERRAPCRGGVRRPVRPRGAGRTTGLGGELDGG